MYSFSIQMTGNLQNIEQQVADALKQEGFGILEERYAKGETD